jgi:hypothetical protein
VDLDKFFDAYTARARLLPGLLLVLPIAVTVYAWDSGNPLGWNGLGGLITAAGGTILLSYVVRDMGKRVEDGLFESWGGRPTDLMLMHFGPMDPTLRARRHATIQKVWPEIPLPTAAEELQDSKAVRDRFRPIVKLLIGRTRDKTKYALLAEENCNYGFRRNMYGARYVGIAFSLLMSIVLGLKLYAMFSAHEHLPGLMIGLELLNVAMLLAWIFWVTRAMVRRGADVYAERLLETLDTLTP